MRQNNQLVAHVLQRLREAIKPGITTKELDQLTEGAIREAGATPAFKGYRGYPASLCVSINEEVVHGIPGPRRLQEGEIVSLDVGVYRNEYYGDAAITVPVGATMLLRPCLVSLKERAKGLLRQASRMTMFTADLALSI